MKLRKETNIDKMIDQYGKKKETHVHEENPYLKYIPSKRLKVNKPKKKKD